QFYMRRCRRESISTDSAAVSAAPAAVGATTATGQKAHAGVAGDFWRHRDYCRAVAIRPAPKQGERSRWFRFRLLDGLSHWSDLRRGLAGFASDLDRLSPFGPLTHCQPHHVFRGDSLLLFSLFLSTRYTQTASAPAAHA